MQIELLQKWATQMHSKRRTSKDQTKFLSGTFYKDISVEPAPVEDVLGNSKSSIILPYGMSALDCAQIYMALRSINNSPEIEVITKGHHGREIGQLISPIDIYNYQLYVAYESAGVATSSMEHRQSGSFIYWDIEEEYCFIAGSETFCETAFPHSPDVLKQYYIDSMVNELEDEKYWETVYLGLQKIGEDSKKGSN